MTRIVFREVSLKAVFRWTDADGKKRQETRKFSQTVNPWNKNARGEAKSGPEIYEELKSERRLWLLQRENDQRDEIQRRAA